MRGGQNPGSSLRCAECKKRRKKCDLSQPQCLRCRQSGIKCSGPKANTTIFINRDTDAFGSQTQRAALIAAWDGRKASSKIKNSHEFYRATLQNVQHVRDMIEKLRPVSSLAINDHLISGDRALLLPTYTALLQEFKPEREVGIFSGDRVGADGPKIYSSIAICIRSLLPLASLRIAALDRCIFSLLALYYGRLHGDAGLRELALSNYTTALSLMSQQVGHSVAESKPSEWYTSIMFMSIALQIFEHLNQVDVFGKGHLAHVNGTLNLLHSAGSRMLQQSPNVQDAFRRLRGLAIFFAIEQRQETFLSESEWSSACFSDAGPTSRDRLNDLAVEIPTLLSSMDSVLAKVRRKSVRSARLMDLGLYVLNEIAALQRRFEEWLYSWKALMGVALFWANSQPVALVEEQRDRECKPRHTNNLQQLVFRSAPTAGMLAHFCSFQLELLMASIDLQESLWQSISHTTSSDSDTRLTMHTLSHGLATDRNSAEEVAKLILEAQPSLSSCLEGLLCLQSPLRIVSTYFDRYGTDQ